MVEAERYPRFKKKLKQKRTRWSDFEIWSWTLDMRMGWIEDYCRNLNEYDDNDRWKTAIVIDIIIHHVMHVTCLFNVSVLAKTSINLRTQSTCHNKPLSYQTQKLKLTGPVRPAKLQNQKDACCKSCNMIRVWREDILKTKLPTKLPISNQFQYPPSFFVFIPILVATPHPVIVFSIRNLEIDNYTTIDSIRPKFTNLD